MSFPLFLTGICRDIIDIKQENKACFYTTLFCQEDAVWLQLYLDKSKPDG